VVLKEALSVAQSSGDRASVVLAHRALARLALVWQDAARAREHFTRALQEAFTTGDARVIAELYLELADVLARLGDLPAAAAELDEGVTLCTGGDGPEGERGPEPTWRMVLRQAELAALRGRATEATSLAGFALKHAGRVHSALGKARVHAFLGTAEERAGRPAEAATHRRAAVTELRHLGDRRTTAEMLIALAEPAGVGSPDVRAWLTEADALAGQVGWQEGVERSRRALARLG
jgi:hypothetical protein